MYETLSDMTLKIWDRNKFGTNSLKMYGDFIGNITALEIIWQ